MINKIMLDDDIKKTKRLLKNHLLRDEARELKIEADSEMRSQLFRDNTSENDPSRSFLRGYNIGLQIENRKLKKKIKKLKSEIKGFEFTISQLYKSEESLINENHHLSIKIKELKSEISLLKEERQNLRDKIGELDVLNENLENEIKEIRDF